MWMESNNINFNNKPPMEFIKKIDLASLMDKDVAWNMLEKILNKHNIKYVPNTFDLYLFPDSY